MASSPEPMTQTRVPLSRERVLTAAVELADRAGIESLTMRILAHELGVEAMSLYYHVANKEAILDGVVNVVVEEINQKVDALDPSSTADDWKTTMRTTILAARAVLLGHPWAPGLIETRVAMSPAILLYFESVLRIMREGGFSYDLAHHAMHALGSRALGFTQELFEPEEGGGDDGAAEMLAAMGGQLPHLIGMMTEISHDDPESTLGWCDDQTEFEFGLDLVLDGLDRLRETDRA